MGYSPWDRKESHTTEQLIFICGTLASGVEKAMATHSSTFAWKIPWAEEPTALCMDRGYSPWGHKEWDMTE